MEKIIYPKKYISTIRTAKIILQIEGDVTYSDVEKLKILLQNMISIDNMSPQQINDKYNLGYKSYVTYLKNMGIKTKNLRESLINRHKQNNTIVTDEKKTYKNNCKFKFSPWKEPNIIGYDLLKIYKFSKPQNMEIGNTYIHRDHMVSVEYGWQNNIPSEHISHPANCEILTSKDNVDKGASCSISYEHLLLRISEWGTRYVPIPKHNIITCKREYSDTQKEHLRNLVKGSKVYNDGMKNYKIFPDRGDTPNPSWKMGMIRKQNI